MSGVRRLTASVRFRITAFAALAALLVLGVAGFLLVAAHRRLLTESLDDGLSVSAADITRQLAERRLPATITGLGDDDAAAQLVDGSGRVLAASANLHGQPPLALPAFAGPSVTRTARMPYDPAHFRVLSSRVPTPAGEGVLHLARNASDIDASVQLLTRSLAVAVPVVAALLAALVWYLVGRTLRPVEAIRTEVAGIGGADLHRRVPLPGGDDEIARLARTMNAMLERVDESARRQQRFVADASHELRSPLTRIRTELEVDQAHPGGADLAATHRSVLAETIGLQHLVDDLLLLARSDAGAAPRATGTPVELDDLVREAVRQARPEGAVRVAVESSGGPVVAGDAQELVRAVRNVVENAVRHATSGVVVSVAPGAGTVSVSVTDDGPGIPAGERDRVFERFTRLDGARSSHSGGTGLGLAIARDIVDRHGGTIAVDGTVTSGTRVVLTLPAEHRSRRGPGVGSAERA
jgi:signal transduction histidine kinase